MLPPPQLTLPLRHVTVPLTPLVVSHTQLAVAFPQVTRPLAQGPHTFQELALFVLLFFGAQFVFAFLDPAQLPLMPFDVAQFARAPRPFPPVQFPQFTFPPSKVAQFAVAIGFVLFVLFVTKASSVSFLGSFGGFVALGHDAPQHPGDRPMVAPLLGVHPVREIVKAVSDGADGWQSANVTVTIRV